MKYHKPFHVKIILGEGGSQTGEGQVVIIVDLLWMTHTRIVFSSSRATVIKTVRPASKGMGSINTILVLLGGLQSNSIREELENLKMRALRGWVGYRVSAVEPFSLPWCVARVCERKLAICAQAQLLDGTRREAIFGSSKVFANRDRGRNVIGLSPC